ncbi:MAG: sigma factor [Xanthomonadales bacterium]|nr:sigma factor [Xanthomonadales bacterium]
MEGIRHQIDQLARRERGRLIASLVARLGSQHLELAEDVAQEALLSALSVWPFRGMPDNPGAWLTRVAGNKAIDRLRRSGRELQLDHDWSPDSADGPGDDRQGELDRLFAIRVPDPELRLMILACHPDLAGVDRLALTLRVVSGFTARDLSQVFLTTEAAIAQRLSRARRSLRGDRQSLTGTPNVFEIQSRLESVLKTVYLMFSLGYAPRSGAALIRRDTALEAVRLAEELAAGEATAGSDSRALAALLCLQASRLDAREDEQGRPVLLKDQNRGRWNRALIDRGMVYLKQAMHRGVPGRYHLEAGIASVYATQPWESIDWPAVLAYYSQLENMTGSPVVTINACVALAFAGELEYSLGRLDQLLAQQPAISSYAPFHIARGEILRLMNRAEEAADCVQSAIHAGLSEPVAEHLEMRLSL